MFIVRKLLNRYRRLRADDGGNFGVVTAIVLPMVLASAGVAVDLTRIVQVRSEMQSAADAAALAAATALSQKGVSNDEAMTLAKQFLAAQLANLMATGTDLAADFQDKIKDASSVSVKKDTSGSSTTYTVDVKGHYDLAMNGLTALLGVSTVALDVESTAQSATESKNAISMYLALDRSGSMSWVTSEKNPDKKTCDNYTKAKWSKVAFTSPCYISKIEALKSAVSVMATSLNTADPTQKYVRVGAVSYTDETQSPQALAWGTSSVTTYVNNLPSVPTGGTDATGAMKKAYDALKKANTAEATAQATKGNTNFQRFIVLMTDGEMTGDSVNWNSDLDTKVRQSCTTAKNDGITIFTVAFMAPDNGKSLLSFCATSADYYYEPDDMADLVAAFKSIGQKAASTMTRLTN